MTYLLIFIVVWPILGAVCCAAIDDDNQSLFKWFCESDQFNTFVQYTFLFVWPYVLYLYLNQRDDKRG